MHSSASTACRSKHALFAGAPSLRIRVKKQRRAAGLLVLLFSLLSAAVAQEPVIQADVKYGVPGDLDQDDVCVWVQPTDKSLSTIIGSDKYADKIFVYSLTGTLIQSIDVGTPGNIDVRYGFSLNGETVDVVGVNGRDAKKILLYKVQSSRTLERIDDDDIFTDDNYGFAMYKSPTSSKYYAFSVNKSGAIKQFELTDNGSGEITGTNARTMSVSGITEGMVCDDETGKLYVAEEDVGVWKFGAEPDAGTSKQQIAAVGTDGFVSDCEGITLYYRANGEGYIIVSSQGYSTFRILDRKEPHAFIGAFDIAQVGSTDGIDVCSVNLGSTYPQGAFLCHSGGSSQWGTRWEKIATALGLTVDTEYWNPRGRDNVASSGTIIATVTSPTGDGNPNIEIIRDGVKPAVGSADDSSQYDTSNGPGGADEEYIGYTFESAKMFTELVFQEGKHYNDGGWWANGSVVVQVQQDGIWNTVAATVSPAYPDGDTQVDFGDSFESYTFTLDEPTAGDGIRLNGTAGGSEPFISVGELEAWAATTNDTDGDGLADRWEDEHFGNNDEIPTTVDLAVSDGSGDFDGDGDSDLTESRLGLIPTDPNSTFKLDVSPGLADTVELSWPSQERLQFEIYITEDLSLPLANWSVIPITDDDGDGAPTHEWTDEDAASHPWRFYRVGLLP